MRRLPCCILFVLALLAPTRLDAQAIHGRLLDDETGEPIAGAVVTPLDVVEREPVRVELRLSVDAIPLAPLTVLSGPALLTHPRLERWGYYERRSMWAPLGAHFLDQNEIQRRHNWTLVGVLRTLPDVRAHDLGGRGLDSRSIAITFRNGLPMSLCLDGMYMSPAAFRDLGLDQLVAQSQVVAMEVYAAAAVRGNARCDIMIWTGLRVP